MDMKQWTPVDKNYDPESDLRTLVSAEEIKKDSERMKACKELAKEKMAAMAKVSGGKEKGMGMVEEE